MTQNHWHFLPNDVWLQNGVLFLFIFAASSFWTFCDFVGCSSLSVPLFSRPGKLRLTIQPFSAINQPMTHSSSSISTRCRTCSWKRTIIAKSLKQGQKVRGEEGWHTMLGLHSATSLPALTEFSCAAARTRIHIQTVAPPIPKPAVSGTSVKVTVSLLRGGPGGRGTAFACLAGWNIKRKWIWKPRELRWERCRDKGGRGRGVAGGDEVCYIAGWHWEKPLGPFLFHPSPPISLLAPLPPQ